MQQRQQIDHSRLGPSKEDKSRKSQTVFKPPTMPSAVKDSPYLERRKARYSQITANKPSLTLES